MKWSYGVTTVPKRREDLLPCTLNSLRLAGFENPRLFVDGSNDPKSWKEEFKLEVTVRDPAIRTAGNWVLSLYELYYRDPTSDRYALFQDDFVTYRNLRLYLDKCVYPERGYWNLYTFPSNQSIVPVHHGKEVIGWYQSNQFGRGAVALVFNRSAVVALLGHQHLSARPQDCHRGHRSIDGGIVTTMTQSGFTEYVHNPSLVQHTGDVSSMGNKPHKKATSFRGEQYDALELLAVSQ